MVSSDELSPAPSKLEKHESQGGGLGAVQTLLQGQSSGGSAKQVGLSFRQLGVTAPDTGTVYAKTLPIAIMNTFGVDQFNFLQSHLLPKLSSGTSRREILTDFTGLVKPGEMLFVLGRPGSGCSTFLRTTANRSALDVSGDLRFANSLAPEFSKNHRRETIYLPEEDRHIAALSVSQTLRFALRMSLPSKIRTKELVEELVTTMGKMFGIEHALQTPVGGQFFPGVSGGERKRVSIAEVLAAGSSVQCFDNSTRGLDSSTALDFVKALRRLTDVGQKTTLATLYQAGENIYSYFDKVLLIDQGQQVFFGRVDEAKAYFEDLGYVAMPGETTAEFLTNITDPTQRRMRPGSKAADISSAQQLSAAFKQSIQFAKLLEEMDQYEKQQAAQVSLIPTSAYNLSYPSQILECLRREYQLIKGQRRVYYTKWVTTIILCLTVGSLYFDLTVNAQSAFTRGGLLFFAIILNGWFQFPELFDAHTNRPVLERQAALNLYRPSAVALARVLIDLPLIAFQHVLCVLPFYFLTKLQVDAGRFFFFYLTLFISTVNFSNLLRAFAYYVSSLDDCFRYGGTATTVCVLFAGFLIPPVSMPNIFGWIHYFNPTYYAFENLLVNEFTGLDIACDASYVIPSIPNAGPQYQTCNLLGAQPGQVTVAGSQYVEALGWSFSHRWRNIGIMIVIAVVYVLASAIGSEIMKFTPQGGAPIIFVKSRSNSRTGSKRSRDIEKEAAMSPSGDISSDSDTGKIHHEGPALTWKNLTVDIGEKHILKGINAYVRPGDFTALCGASGAGKTTLLTALSQTNFAGTLAGEVLFGGKEPGRAFKKATGFAQQQDLHDGTATVREALEFSALLRQPQHYSRSEKLAYVDHILDLLDLVEVQHALIGDEQSGLGVEVTKRVTIAVELVARPKVLFADEPTSGLDSQGAVHIVDYLRRLAQNGQAVLVTIHQPSASLFANFGSVKQVLPYFERHDATPPPNSNPAEFVLETVGAGINARNDEKGTDWAIKWDQSPEAKNVAEEIEHIQKQGHALEDFEDGSAKEFNGSIFEQTWLLTLRILKNQWRNVPYMYSKIWVHIVCAILVGLTFFQLGSGPQDLQNRAFSVFFIVFLVSSIVNTILIRFFVARLYWEFREGPSKIYSWIALCNASILGEMPGSLVCGVLYYLLWYFPSGLPLGASAGYVFLTVLTYEVFQVLLGLLMMAVSPDLGVAGNVLVFMICTMNWYNGLIVPYNQMQVFWRYWLYYINPFTYALGGLLIAVVEGVPVHCAESDLHHFSPPPGQSCGAYAGSWAKSAMAQLLNPLATDNCSVCIWTSGDQYLEGFNLGPDKTGGKWGFWGIFVAFTVSNLVLVYFLTWATKIKNWKIFYFF
ncbi:MAG: hypothetical protein LQ352_005065 [Teloschistes flavicans]|nr:MAG: hypothetical protein LQ352_005065 [Teloschistes flavicans]